MPARWKSTGFWTNSCSGHPCPGEKLPAAVARLVDEVLGIIPADITLILPDFRCRTVTKAGILENSICQVFRVTVHTRLVHPDPNEVEILAWIPWTALVARASDDARSLTPCCRERVRRLRLWAPTPVAGRRRRIRDCHLRHAQRDPHKYVGRQYRTSLCSSGGYTVEDSPSTVVPANWSIARCSPCIGAG
ncbi:NUDIX domain-containing protein [Rhodococcus sp. IEGM 248]|nr:NUDIX domain-containing protein [Rhodococcus sp. IEGM 248]